MDILSQVKDLVDKLNLDPMRGTCPYTTGQVIFCEVPYCETCIFYKAYKYRKER